MKNLLGLIIIISVACSCSPSSRITSSWKKAKFRGGYTDVLIAGLTSNVEAKSTIENDLGTALAGQGAVVSKSLNLFPPNFTKETGKEEMMRRIRHSAVQAIITVSLIHKETTSHYVPGGTSMMSPYPGGFWGYYSYMYPTMYGPGYYEQDKIYYMETNVYDAKSDELVWSAHSETYNPSNLSGFSRELAKIIAEKLVKDRIIIPVDKLGKPSHEVTSRNTKK